MFCDRIGKLLRRWIENRSVTGEYNSTATKQCFTPAKETLSFFPPECLISQYWQMGRFVLPIAMSTDFALLWRKSWNVLRQEAAVSVNLKRFGNRSKFSTALSIFAKLLVVLLLDDEKDDLRKVQTRWFVVLVRLRLYAKGKDHASLFYRETTEKKKDFKPSSCFKLLQLQ